MLFDGVCLDYGCCVVCFCCVIEEVFEDVEGYFGVLGWNRLYF